MLGFHSLSAQSISALVARKAVAVQVSEWRASGFWQRPPVDRDELGDKELEQLEKVFSPAPALVDTAYDIPLIAPTITFEQNVVEEIKALLGPQLSLTEATDAAAQAAMQVLSERVDALIASHFDLNIEDLARAAVLDAYLKLQARNHEVRKQREAVVRRRNLMKMLFQ